MFSPSWWVIAGYYGLTIVAIASFHIYLKRKTGEGLFGAFQFDIPKKLIWIFILGIIGSIIIIIYPVVFLIYPDSINIVFPISLLRSFPFEVTGIFLTVMGFIVVIISMLQLGLSARFLIPEQKTKLITSGIYGFCRNPIYVGAYLSFFGIFLLLPSFIYFIGFCLFLLNNHFRILQEEKFLTDVFGPEYEDYRQHVGRYLPKIGK